MSTLLRDGNLSDSDSDYLLPHSCGSETLDSGQPATSSPTSPGTCMNSNIWSMDNGGSSFLPSDLGLQNHHQFESYGDLLAGSPLSGPYHHFGDYNQSLFDDDAERSWGYYPNGTSFPTTVNGNGSAFTDETHQWSSQLEGCNSRYDPFKAGSFIDDLDSVAKFSSRDSGADKFSASTSPVEPASSRPTFADMAKKPSSPVSEPPTTPALSRDGGESDSQESLSSLQSRKSRQQVFRPAHAKTGGYHVPLPIHPDSRYGLDDFDSDVSSKVGRSLSCNDILTSKVGDGIEFAQDVESRVENGDLPSAKKARAGSDAWFDPKRIFKSGQSTSMSDTPAYASPANTVLNNKSERYAPSSSQVSSSYTGWLNLDFI